MRQSLTVRRRASNASLPILSLHRLGALSLTLVGQHSPTRNGSKAGRWSTDEQSHSEEDPIFIYTMTELSEYFFVFPDPENIRIAHQ